MHRAILFLAMLSFTFSAMGQYSLNGKVMSNDKNPLVGATIYFEKSYRGAVSNTSGEFSIDNLKGGHYNVVVSFIGYKTKEFSIEINSDYFLEVFLEKSLIGLDEVIVKASRAGMLDPVAVELIDREELKAKNFGQDIPSLLSLTPSLISSSDAGNGIGYSTFRIRGTDANRINITIDGIPVNDAESHGVWWVNMPDFVSSVEDIQIQRGVGTSTNGAAAFGATVNIRTENLSKDAFAETNSGFGSFNTWKTSNSVGTGLMDNGFSFSMRYSAIESDGYIDRASSSLRSFFASAGYYSEKNILKLNYFAGKEKTYQAWDGIPSNILPDNRRYNGIGMYTNEYGFTEYYDNETDNYQQDHLQLHYTRKLSDNIWLNTSLHYTKGRGYYEQYKEDEDMKEYNIPALILTNDTISETDLIRQKWLDNDFYGIVSSLNIKKEKFEARLGGSINSYSGDHFGKVIWARYSSSIENNHKWYESTGRKEDYNVFAKINYALTTDLSAYGDLQMRKIIYQIDGIDDDKRDISQEHNFLFLNPKMGLYYRPNDFHSAYFSFGVANREPNRDNYVDADPNLPGPKHETLNDFEAGYTYRDEMIITQFNLYYMDYNNQLVLTGEINDVGAPVMTNVKESYRAGIEVSLKLNIGNKTSWESNLSLSSNKIQNIITQVDNWDYWNDPENEPYQFSRFYKARDIAFSPSVSGSGLLSFEVAKGLEMSLLSKYVGKQYIDNSQSDDRMLDAYLTNDFIINYEFKSSFAKSIFFNILVANLLNEEYESFAWIYRYVSGGEEAFYDGYFPQAGRHFMITAGFRF